MSWILFWVRVLPGLHVVPEPGVFISGDLDSISGPENPAEAKGDASHSLQQIPGMHLKPGLGFKARFKSCFCRKMRDLKEHFWAYLALGL